MSMFEYAAKLDRVVDGDTVDLAVDLGHRIWIHERYRLFGINAPESRTRDLREKAKGLAATEHLKSLLADKPLTIKTHKDQRGKFGRWLADIYVGEVNINQKMVEDGHAVEADY